MSHLLPSNSPSLLTSTQPLCNFSIRYNATKGTSFINNPPKPSVSRTSFLIPGLPKTLAVPSNYPIWRRTHLSLCSANDVYETSTDTHSQKQQEREAEELGLLGKPIPLPITHEEAPEVDPEPPQRPNEDEVLEPFLKFFKPRESIGESDDSEWAISEESMIEEKTKSKKVSVEYYEPKPGDFVVGVVASGNENRLDVNVGADMLGTMLTKEVLPLHDKEIDYLLCDLGKDAEEFLVHGKMGIMSYEEAVSKEEVLGRPVVEPGTVLFAEVLGRTLSGRPLLSTRRFFRRIAWHRVRQVFFLLLVS